MKGHGSTEHDRGGRRGRRRAILLGVLGLSVSLLGFGLLPVAAGRTSYPHAERWGAEHALAEAQRRLADYWAADLYEESQGSFRRAVDEGLRQKARLFPFQDFSRVRDAFACTAEKARDASVQAKATKESSRIEAGSAIADAQLALREAERCAAMARLGPVSRVQLQRARSDLAEAKERAEREEFDRAADRANHAVQASLGILERTKSLASRYLDAATVETWKAWVQETVSRSRARKQPAIIVYKEKNRLDLYASGRLVKSYPADMGRNKIHRKLSAGDWATPEGRYQIIQKKGRGQSKYYMALQLNYPTEADRKRWAEAKSNGLLPRHAGPGGLIEIHGAGGRGDDWTQGCVALSNRDVADLFSRVGVGTPVTIVGGDGRGGEFSDLARKLGSLDRR